MKTKISHTLPFVSQVSIFSKPITHIYNYFLLKSKSFFFYCFYSYKLSLLLRWESNFDQHERSISEIQLLKADERVLVLEEGLRGNIRDKKSSLTPNLTQSLLFLSLYLSIYLSIYFSLHTHTHTHTLSLSVSLSLSLHTHIHTHFLSLHTHSPSLSTPLCTTKTSLINKCSPYVYYYIEAVISNFSHHCLRSLLEAKCVLPCARLNHVGIPYVINWF